MSKAEEIVSHIFTIIDLPNISPEALRLCIKHTNEILNRKCVHPWEEVIHYQGIKSNWKCTSCDKEVTAIKYEEVK